MCLIRSSSRALTERYSLGPSINAATAGRLSLNLFSTPIYRVNSCLSEKLGVGSVSKSLGDFEVLTLNPTQAALQDDSAGSVRLQEWYPLPPEYSPRPGGQKELSQQ
jgi:hypothetical protein